jgi:hypothetical protein
LIIPSHKNRMQFEPLEGRVLLSSVVISLAPAPDAAGVKRASVEAGLTLTRTDRRNLIRHLNAPLALSLSKTLRHSGDAAFDATLLQHMIRRDGPNYFYNGRVMARDTAFIKQFLSPRVPIEVAKADAILAHKFPEQINAAAFNVQLPAKIDWDAQPKTTDNPDFLHALNEHGYWRDLTLAYQFTGDAKYVRELISELGSWSTQTPALKNPDDWIASSPHWWLLDVAARAKNWLDAYFMVLGSADWTAQANTLFLARLFDHGDFLYRVTPSGYAKNRTALHAGGLLRVGMIFPEFADAPAWENKGVDMTFRSLAAQFRPDGSHVEQTPAYQITADDAFLETYFLGQLNQKSYWTRNRRRFFVTTINALFQMLTPSGGLPGLSDTYRSSNAKPFLTRCGLILGDNRFLISAATLEDVLLLGTRRLGGTNSQFAGKVDNRGASFALPDAGYYMLRGKDVQSDSQGNVTNFQQIQVDAGPKGGAHGHFDLLSFEFQGPIDPPLIPDPGPFRYDNSADRNYVISTPAHNTISIDRLNHEAVEEVHSPKIVVDEFQANATEARFTAHHHAYEFLAGRPTVGRTLWLDRSNSSWDIMIAVDWGRSDVSQSFTTSFNLAGNGSNVTEISPGSVDAFFTKGFRIRVQSLAIPGQQVALNNTFISSTPPPLEKDPATRVSVTQTGTSVVFVTLISRYVTIGADPFPPATAEFEAPPVAGQPIHVRLTYPDNTTRSVTFNPPNLAPLPG